MGKLKHGLVKLEGCNFIAECKLEDKTWNGYAMPYFTKDQVERIIELLNEHYGFERYKLKADGNDLYLLDGVGYQKEAIIPDLDYYGEPMYGLGCGSWMWYDLDDIYYVFDALSDDGKTIPVRM